MKLSTNFLTVLAFSSAVFASPALEKKQTTPISVFNGALQSLQRNVATDQAALNSAITAAKGSVGASAAITAAATANLAAIATALRDATKVIVGATTSTAGGIVGSGKTLLQSELDMVASNILTVQNILKGISATLSVTATNLGPAAQSTVAKEVAQVNSLIQPFITPVAGFVGAVQTAGATAKLTVNGLNNAVSGARTILANSFASTGATFPAVGAPSTGAPSTGGPTTPKVPAVGAPALPAVPQVPTAGTPTVNVPAIASAVSSILSAAKVTNPAIASAVNSILSAARVSAPAGCPTGFVI